MLTLTNLLKVKFFKKKRVGRGGNRGKNCGYGNKGQVKRAGKSRLGFEGGQKSLIRRTPKLKGYNFNPQTDRQEAVLSLTILDQNFDTNTVITVDNLRSKKLINERIKKVRIIRVGNTSKKFSFNGNDIHLTQGVKKLFN